MTATAIMIETDNNVMSNFDHEIDRDVEAELRSKPNEVYAGYPGWNFYARVWHDGSQFNAEVKQYGSLRGIIQAETLEGIMEETSNEYGWE